MQYKVHRNITFSKLKQFNKNNSVYENEKGLLCFFGSFGKLRVHRDKREHPKNKIKEKKHEYQSLWNNNLIYNNNIWNI